MSLHPALKELIELKLTHTQRPQWEMPIAEVRQAFASFWSPGITGERVEVAAVEDRHIPAAAGSIGARIYTPVVGDGLPLIVYYHGGGYVKGGLDEADAFCRRLARSAGAVVVSVAYRLAPEHPFPAALDDACAAAAWAFAHAEQLRGDRNAFVVCGESSGGNLAAVVCLLARGRSDLAIAYQVLIQPVVDFSLSFPSIAMPATECLVPKEDLAWYYREYYGAGRDPRDPRVSPLWAEDLSGLPPALIIAAEHDTLRDEAEAYAWKLRAAGVDARCSCYPGMIHGFLGMGGLVAEAQVAIDEVGAAVRGVRREPETAAPAAS